MVIRGSLEELGWLLDLDRVGNCSANFSSCLSDFPSSLVGILILMLSGQPMLFVSSSSSSSSELSLPSSTGPHSLQLVTSKSRMSRPYSDGGSLWDTQQLLWLLYLTVYQKQWVKSNSTGKNKLCNRPRVLTCQCALVSLWTGRLELISVICDS